MAEEETIESRRERAALAWAAYDRDEVLLLNTDLTGYTHLLASRQGLFAVAEGRWSRVARGFFFGLTFCDGDVFAFEAGDQPRGPTRRGRILRLQRAANRIVAAEVLVKGLDNGCHAIDFIHGRLHVVDTYNQQIVRLTADMHGVEYVRPLHHLAGARMRDDHPDYRHVNSLLQIGEHTLLLLHNGANRAGRKSEIAVYDREWRHQATWQLEGLGCHGLALLPDGRLLSCGSMAGELISLQGDHWSVSEGLTRGLAVGDDGIAVGSSPFVKREQRDGLEGRVSFYGPDLSPRSVLEVPCAPTELRRMDARDASLSLYLKSVPWGGSLPPHKHTGSTT